MPGCFSFLKSSSKMVREEAAMEKQQRQEAPAKSHNCACSFPAIEPNFDASSTLPAYADIYHHSDALSTISQYVDSISTDLRKVSVAMHSNPEPKWEEYETLKLLAGFMEKQQGWKVKRGAYGCETGFEAVFQHGSGGRVIGFNSEVRIFKAAQRAQAVQTYKSDAPVSS
jgi:hypothetical protein